MVPPAGWFNWFWKLVGTDWITYLDAKVNGSGSLNLRPYVTGRAQVVPVDDYLEGGLWRNGAAQQFTTPAGTNTYLETTFAGPHDMTVVLNKTALFDRIIGPGDAIRIDSIDVDNERLGAADVYIVEITGSVSGIVFSETVIPGPTARTVDVLTESAGAPKLDTSETWTLRFMNIDPTTAADIRIYDLDIQYTITTA